MGEMEHNETIDIPKGTMINLSRHEDDDALIAEVPLKGTVIKRFKDALEVDISGLGVYYIHQPEKPEEK